MIIAIIGSGGREHAICQKINESKNIKKIFCIPGNGGTKKIAENIEIDINNFDKIKSFLIKEKVDLTIVGPEEPLVNGVVDFLKKYDLKVFGPDKYCSQLEGSKIFTKKICDKENIPTASFKIFEDIESSLEYLNKKSYPLVVKADGLAAGKGVYICKDYNESLVATQEIFAGKFGNAQSFLVEDYLEGEEMSYFIICDGDNYKFFGTAQDHKRVGEGDKGKNTGGMGCYSPSRLFNSDLSEKINKKIINPTLTAIKDLGTSYKGFLYVGLMIKNNEPYLIEYNVRMGDPECQTIIPKLKSDLLDIILACIESKLDQIQIDWHDINSLCIVLCSKGYPDQYKKDMIIKNLTKINLDQNQKIYHAGTKIKNEDIVSNGGRVLNFVNLSTTFKKARESNIKLIEEINWPNGFYRKDIGFNVIE